MKLSYMLAALGVAFSLILHGCSDGGSSGKRYEEFPPMEEMVDIAIELLKVERVSLPDEEIQRFRIPGDTTPLPYGQVVSIHGMEGYPRPNLMSMKHKELDRQGVMDLVGIFGFSEDEFLAIVRGEESQITHGKMSLSLNKIVSGSPLTLWEK